MATKKIKKRVSNGISQFHGNKPIKDGSKLQALKKPEPQKQQPAEKKEAQEAQQLGQKKESSEHNPQSAPVAPLVITITRHHYPALKSVLGTQAFMAADGRELRNLLDLATALEEMAEDTFRHHASETHNHFSNWLKDCFELEDLASSIKGAAKQEAHAKVLKNMLSELLK